MYIDIHKSKFYKGKRKPVNANERHPESQCTPGARQWTPTARQCAPDCTPTVRQIERHFRRTMSIYQTKLTQTSSTAMVLAGDMNLHYADVIYVALTTLLIGSIGSICRKEYGFFNLRIRKRQMNAGVRACVKISWPPVNHGTWMHEQLNTRKQSGITMSSILPDDFATHQPD